MTDDLIERAQKALEGVTEGPWLVASGIAINDPHGNTVGLVRDKRDRTFIATAHTLLPEAIEEIKRLEAKANQMVADKINLRSELLSVQAKLAVAVGALGSIGGNTCCDSCREAALVAHAALAEIKGEKP